MRTRLVVLDMGGVIVRDVHVDPELTRFLGFPGSSLQEVHKALRYPVQALCAGLIDEDGFWDLFGLWTGKNPEVPEGLCCRFFHPSLDEAAVRVVGKLRAQGIRVVCGTNVIPSHYAYHQRHHQYDCFDAVYPSPQLHANKPSPAFYLAICRKEGVEPDAVFFADDAARNVEAAKGLGMHAYLYTDAAQLESDLWQEGFLR